MNPKKSNMGKIIKQIVEKNMHRVREHTRYNLMKKYETNN